MLTKAGAKLLDFGLARPGAGLGGVSGSTALPTEAKPLTSVGTVLGTFQYMAPEQLEGAEADPRTDIFALGALLYEMATARRAFEGKSKTSLIAAILSTQPPPISSVQPVMPPALDHVVTKCLEKDPDDRWQSAHDVASELRWIGDAGSQAGVPTTLSLRRRSRERLAWVLAAVFAAAAAAGLGWALQLRETRARGGPALPGRAGPAPGDPLCAGLARAPWPSHRTASGWPSSPPATAQPASRSATWLRERRSPRGHRRRHVPVLVARQPLARLLRPGETQEDRGRGRAGPGRVRRPRRPRRKLGPGRHDRLRARHQRSAREGPRRRRHAHAGDTRGRPAGDPPQPLVPAGRPALPLHAARGERALRRDRRRLPGRGRAAGAARARLEPAVRRRLPRRPWSTATWSRSASTPAGRPSRDRRCRSPRPSSTTTRAISPISPCRGPGCSSTARSVCGGRSSSGWIAPGRSSPRSGSRPTTRGLHLGPDGHDARRRALGLGRRRLRRLDPRPAAPAGDALDLRVRSQRCPRRAVARRGAARGLGLQRRRQGRSRPSGSSPAREAARRSRSWRRPPSTSRGGRPTARCSIGATQETETGFDVAYLAVADPSKIVRVTTSRFDEQDPALSPNGRWIAYSSNETGRAEIFVCDFPKGARKWQVSRSGGEAPTWRGDCGRAVLHRPRGGDGRQRQRAGGRPGLWRAGAPAVLPGRRFRPASPAFALRTASASSSSATTPRPSPSRSASSARWRRLVEK